MALSGGDSGAAQVAAVWWPLVPALHTCLAEIDHEEEQEDGQHEQRAHHPPRDLPEDVGLVADHERDVPVEPAKQRPRGLSPVHTETPLIPRRRRAGSRSTPRQTVPVLPCRTLTRHILLGKDAPPRGRPPWAQQKPILASEDPRRPTVPLPGWTVDSCQRWPRAGTDAQEGPELLGMEEGSRRSLCLSLLGTAAALPLGNLTISPCPVPNALLHRCVCRLQKSEQSGQSVNVSRPGPGEHRGCCWRSAGAQALSPWGSGAP